VTSQRPFNLGDLYREQGRYADAEPLLKRSLTILERALRPNHSDVAIALNDLQGLYQQQGRYTDAGPVLKKVTGDS
jgi:tetratricopeptide (TPR) repeat protein